MELFGLGFGFNGGNILMKGFAKALGGHACHVRGALGVYEVAESMGWGMVTWP